MIPEATGATSLPLLSPNEENQVPNNRLRERNREWLVQAPECKISLRVCAATTHVTNVTQNVISPKHLYRPVAHQHTQAPHLHTGLLTRCFSPPALQHQTHAQSMRPTLAVMLTITNRCQCASITRPYVSSATARNRSLPRRTP